MRVHPLTKQALDLFHEGTLAFAKAERIGFRFDIEQATKQHTKLTKKIQILEKKLYASDFFREWQRSSKSQININSNPQLASFLYKVKKIKPEKETKTKKGSTDEKALQALKIPALDILLQIRKLKKLRDTYLGGFMTEQVDGVIHPSFDLSFVTTYRSSSSNPNFQNIPKRDKEALFITRSCLYPREGNLLMEVDFSQLEVSIAACYHKDPTMLDYLRHQGDMHKDVAIQTFFIRDFDHKKIKGHDTLRKAAKNGFVFPQFYGDYYKPCAKALACTWGMLPTKGRWKPKQGILVQEDLYLSDLLMKNKIHSLDEFTEHIKQIESHFWNKRFPVYRDWKEDHWTKYQSNGYVDLLTGFRCQGIMGKNDAINYPVQGAAFHCLLWSFIRITDILEQSGMKSRIIGQIHDAIIFDIFPPELEKVKKIATKVMTVDLPKAWKWIIVPLRVEFDVGEVDKSWAFLT